VVIDNDQSTGERHSHCVYDEHNAVLVGEAGWRAIEETLYLLAPLDTR
jgi:hypothetical protein